MKKIDYIKLHTYLFFESILWTLIDLVRAGRMRLSKRMSVSYKNSVADNDQSDTEIKN